MEPTRQALFSMSWMRVPRGTAVVAVVLAGCTPVRTPLPPPEFPAVLPRDMVGCYAAYNGAGEPFERAMYPTPPRLRLTDDPVSELMGSVLREPAWTVVRLGADGTELTDMRDRNFLYWRAAASDSIRITLSTGFSGADLTVPARMAADTLRGRATWHTDAGPVIDREAGAAMLVRTACPGE